MKEVNDIQNCKEDAKVYKLFKALKASTSTLISTAINYELIVFIGKAFLVLIFLFFGSFLQLDKLTQSCGFWLR
jgi:hypothetical protein